jgi:hypothetical protein
MMKPIRIFWIVLAIAGMAMPTEQGQAQPASVRAYDSYRKLQSSFSLGEKLTYLAHYGFINAGRGVVSLDGSLHTRNGRSCYKVDIDAKTVGMFALGVKVKDTWRSYIDKDAIMPHEFYRNISENKYKLEETSYFRQAQQGGQVRVKANKKGNESTQTYDIPLYTQDMVSGYYYLRTLDFAKMKVGDIIKMDTFFEDELYDFQVRFLGREVLKTKFGKINAFVMSPVMPENSLFDGEDAIRIWVSDDRNRVPLKVSAKMFVGAFEIELTEHEGLAHDFSWAN